jgi:hypothetical protein
MKLTCYNMDEPCDIMLNEVSQTQKCKYWVGNVQWNNAGLSCMKSWVQWKGKRKEKEGKKR